MEIGQKVRVRFKDHPNGLLVKVGQVGFVCGDGSINYSGIICYGEHGGRAIFFNENQIITQQ